MIQYNITKTDAGQTGLLGCPSTSAPLWIDERERILARIGRVKGCPEIGTIVYTLSYHSKTEWVIRSIEIVASNDARPRSNKTTSIILPAQCYKKGREIIEVFKLIKRDTDNNYLAPSEELIEKLQGFDEAIKEWRQSPKNNRFGIKSFADEIELINLLDHILQKEYTEYQTIYFIPTSCVFHPDENYVQLPGGVDELITKNLETKDIGGGIIFTPEVFSRSFFKSEIDQIKIKWSSNGFKTIVKSISDTTISTSEIFHEVKLNDLFSVSPNDANVSCSIDGKSLECNNGIIYVPYGRIKDCKFIISKQGYTSVEHKYLESRQSIRLEEKLIMLQPEFKTTDCRKRVKVQLKMSDFSEFGDINSDNLVICSRDYFSKLEKAKTRPSLKQVLFNKITLVVFCTSILLGGLCGAYGMRRYHEKHPITITKYVEVVREGSKDGVQSPEKRNGTQRSSSRTEQEMIERYLSQEVWRKGKCSEKVENKGRTKEPEGLWEAMRTYDFETIKKIYDQLTQEGYQVGNLKKVIEAIDTHSPASLPPCTNYGNLGSNIPIGKGPIDVNNWINSLKPSQKQCPICKKMVEEQKYTSHYNACKGE